MNINTAKIKYVVAREGLIIVSLLICMAVSLYIESWKTNKIDTYVKGAKEVIHIVDPFKKYDTDNKATYPAPTTTEQPNPKAQFPLSTPYNLMKNTMDRDYPNLAPGELFILDKPDNSNVSARYDENGNKLFTSFTWNIDFKNQVGLYLFFAYPVYLLVRFIVWSILTVLKNKKEDLNA